MISASVVIDAPSANAIENGRRLRSTRATLPCIDLGAEALGLRAHLRHQVRTHDAVAEPGPVLHHRRQHQLPARLEALDEQRLQVGARGVERRRQACWARSDDDDFAIGHA